jgi:16S rRNA (guanine(966)-N(2))-methyltransferase RsmD
MLEKTQVRIVAGRLRGRKLQVVVKPGRRPTPQLVREAYFSIMGNAIPGRLFYDLFAGTGVVGMEAISRGAVGARLIENDPRQAADIQKHLERFGIDREALVLKADAYRWAEHWQPSSSVPVNFFLSPPFIDLQQRLEDFLGLVHTLLAKAPPESVVTLQLERGFPVQRLPDLPAWDIRRYGRNLLLVYVVPDPAAPVNHRPS